MKRVPEDMGEVRATVKLQNERDCVLANEGLLADEDIRTAEVDALIDTGAVMNLLPREVVDSLGLEILDKTKVRTATEQLVELDVAGPMRLTIAGRNWATDCLVGPPRCEPLIGQLVLERLDLVVSPARQTVTVNPDSPERPTLKLK